MVDRSGAIIQEVLVVYPPGTNDTERTRLWFARTWPCAGACAGLASLMCLGDVVPSWLLTSVVFTTYAAGVVAGLVSTRRIRPRVRRAVATLPRDARPWCAGDTLRAMRRAEGILDRLDRRAAAGDVDPVRYELEWGRAYALLDDRRAHPAPVS